MLSRFESKFRKDASGCWLWIASVGTTGYGQFSVAGRPRKAHRVAFLLYRGHWPTPYCLHRCDNPLCVNPEHLREGTAQDNSVDMIRKGRGKQPRLAGEKNPNSKLSTDAVASIRSRLAGGESCVCIAKDFQVSASCVRQVRRGVTYRVPSKP